TRWGRESRRVWGRVTGRVWGNKGRGGGGGRGGGRGVSGGEGGGECEGGGRRPVRGRDRGRGGERGKGDGRNGTGQHWEGRDLLTVLKPIVSAPWSVFQRWFGFSGRSGGGGDGLASEEGVGTTILVSLPLRARHLAGDDTSPVDEATAGDAGPWLEARRSVLGSVRGKRALVVDGMKLRREAVSECLRYLGISVAVAATAGQAGFLLMGSSSCSSGRSSWRDGSERRRGRVGDGEEEEDEEGEMEEEDEEEKEKEEEEEEEEGDVGWQEEGQSNEGKEWSSETAAEEERKGEEGEEERNGEEGGEGEDGEEGEEGEEGEQRSWDVVFIEADAFGSATGFGFGKRVISHWQHQQHPGGRETPPPSPTTPHPSSFPSSSSNPSVSPPPALLSTPLPLRSPHPLSTPNPLPTPHPLPTSNSLPTPWPLPQLLASVSHPPLVLTGRSACEGVQARAAGFSDVLARPWMASDAARLLQEMFAPPPAGSVSAAHSAPAQEQEEDLPQQLFSRLALEDASSVLREMLGGREVLVVDDNAVNRVVARKSLVGLGARVEVAASGELALQRLLHPHAFVLALVDINMPPGIDGLETCRHIRAREALTSQNISFIRRAWMGRFRNP
ncbi:unnamed protein product, partial [Closterium sp. NIES-65]